MRRRFAIVALAALVLTAGCGEGGGGEGRSPAAVLTQAAGETADAKTARMAMVVSGIPGVAEGAAVRAEGVYDFPNRAGVMRFDLPEIAGQALGTVEMIQQGTVMYMRFPTELARALGDKPWVKLDVAEAAEESTGFNLGSLMGNNGGPTEILAYLRAASEDTTLVGTETLRGDKVPRYRTMLDAKKGAAAAPEDQRAAIEKAAEALGGQLLPADVWIDDEGRLRKLTYTVDISKMKLEGTAAADLPASQRTGEMSVSMELYDFGVDVKADPPPADQVTDLGNVLSSPRT